MIAWLNLYTLAFAGRSPANGVHFLLVNHLIVVFHFQNGMRRLLLLLLLLLFAERLFATISRHLFATCLRLLLSWLLLLLLLLSDVDELRKVLEVVFVCAATFETRVLSVGRGLVASMLVGDVGGARTVLVEFVHVELLIGLLVEELLDGAGVLEPRVEQDLAVIVAAFLF